MTEPTEPNPAEAMLVLADSLGTLLEAAAGYRSKAEAAGFSPTAAEGMAVELHSHMLRAAFASAPSPEPPKRGRR